MRYLGKTRSHLGKNLLHPQKYALPYTYECYSCTNLVTKTLMFGGLHIREFSTFLNFSGSEG